MIDKTSPDVKTVSGAPSIRVACRDCKRTFVSHWNGARTNPVRCPKCSEKHAAAYIRKWRKDKAKDASRDRNFDLVLMDEIVEEGAVTPDFFRGARLRSGQIAEDLKHGVWPDGTRFRNGKKVWAVKGGALRRVYGARAQDKGSRV